MKITKNPKRRRDAFEVGGIGLLVFVVLILVIALTQGGCTPYVGYTHLSQPNVADDGYDFVCGGFEYEKRRVRADAGICENLANSHTDTHARLDIRIRLYER